jgi:hypothetical protein
MPYLQALDISRCRKIQSIAQCFASSPRSLSCLDISHCSLIADADVVTLQQQRPFLKICTSRPVIVAPPAIELHTHVAAMPMAQQLQPQQLAAGILVQG